MVEMLNGIGSYDMVMTVQENCTLSFTVDLTPLENGGNATLKILQSIPNSPTDKTITIHVDPFDDWHYVSLFAWKGTNDFYMVWPGITMTDDNGDGWYEAEIPSEYTNLIVSTDGRQSYDMTMTGSGDIWITMDFDAYGDIAYHIVYADPGPASTKKESNPLEYLSLLGEGIPELNWNANDPSNKMDRIGDTFLKELTVPAGSILQIMFCGNGSFDSGYSFGFAQMLTYADFGVFNNLYYDGYNIYVTVEKDSTLLLTVDCTGVDQGATPKLLIAPVLDESETPDDENPEDPDSTEETEDSQETSSKATRPREYNKNNKNSSDNDSSILTVIIIVAVALVVVGVGVTVTLVLINKKK